MRLVLFDIDGTLLLTHGAGMRALNRAFENNRVRPDVLKTIRPDGKTDPQIVREIMKACNRDSECTSDMLTEFFDVYLSFLREEMAACTKMEVLPGVRKLLEELAEEPELGLGVATGNIEEGAYLKLRYAQLDSFFAFGGFGSDSEDRTEVIRWAIARGAERIAPEKVDAAFVIGDTPRDILHGRAAGARTIAVATGTYPLETLKSYEPDLVVRTLEAAEPIKKLLLC
ncbi:MAG TPA: HAD hydrolase-like protein [Acidobacteriota bacterium]|nr:HAD hydrolase-like protein [Acidobacteriota bacterium]